MEGAVGCGGAELYAGRFEGRAGGVACLMLLGRWANRRFSGGGGEWYG